MVKSCTIVDVDPEKWAQERKAFNEKLIKERQELLNSINEGTILWIVKDAKVGSLFGYPQTAKVVKRDHNILSIVDMYDRPMSLRVKELHEISRRVESDDDILIAENLETKESYRFDPVKYHLYFNIAVREQEAAEIHWRLSKLFKDVGYEAIAHKMPVIPECPNPPEYEEILENKNPLDNAKLLDRELLHQAKSCKGKEVSNEK